jgi:hypothetical protein
MILAGTDLPQLRNAILSLESNFGIKICICGKYYIEPERIHNQTPGHITNK